MPNMGPRRLILFLKETHVATFENAIFVNIVFFFFKLEGDIGSSRTPSTLPCLEREHTRSVSSDPVGPLQLRAQIARADRVDAANTFRAGVYRGF